MPNTALTAIGLIFIVIGLVLVSIGIGPYLVPLSGLSIGPSGVTMTGIPTSTAVILGTGFAFLFLGIGALTASMRMGTQRPSQRRRR